jgi:hypothetical protein
VALLVDVAIQLVLLALNVPPLAAIDIAVVGARVAPILGDVARAITQSRCFAPG